MKVVSETSTRLTIRHQPFRQWLTGALFTIMGLALLAQLPFAAKKSTLVCDRN